MQRLIKAVLCIQASALSTGKRRGITSPVRELTDFDTSGIAWLAALQINRRYHGGVPVDIPQRQPIPIMLDDLEELLAGPELGSRSRAAGEEVFSLETGTEAYRRLYAEILEAEQA